MDLGFAYGNGIYRRENSSQEGSTDRLAGYNQWVAIKMLRQSIARGRVARVSGARVNVDRIRDGRDGFSG